MKQLDQDPWRNRKGFLSQNVLGVVQFDLTSFVLAGWEGPAHDLKVLRDTIFQGLPIPVGKYYFDDAGYGLKPFCSVPFRGVRNHLKEWA